MNKIASSESVVKDIRRRTRRKYSLEVKIRIVLEPVVKFAKPSIMIWVLPQNLPRIVYFVVASRDKRRGDPESGLLRYARNDD